MRFAFYLHCSVKEMQKKSKCNNKILATPIYTHTCVVIATRTAGSQQAVDSDPVSHVLLDLQQLYPRPLGHTTCHNATAHPHFHLPHRRFALQAKKMSASFNPQKAVVDIESKMRCSTLLNALLANRPHCNWLLYICIRVNMFVFENLFAIFVPICFALIYICTYVCLRLEDDTAAGGGWQLSAASNLFESTARVADKSLSSSTKAVACSQRWRCCSSNNNKNP